MKKMRKWILTAVLMSLCAMCLLFAGCGNTVTYQFETNGGSTVESVEVTKGENFTLPTPEREGYSFEGWYSEPDFSGTPILSATADKDQTFYAKWEQMYLVSFDVGKGSLNAPKLYLKAGANIYNAVKDIVPSAPQGYAFGAWFVGDSELTARATMTADGVTLTAHYKVGYTVETYLQKLDLDGYEKGDTVTLYEYAGKECTASLLLEGFVEVANDNTVKTKVLSEDPAQNVYRLYFDRKQCVLYFDSNYPEGDVDSVSQTALAGQQIALPDDLFAYEGYFLVGWSVGAGGEVYKSNYIESILFYGAEEYQPALYDVSTDVVFSAVWEKAYTDLFGGVDYIYLFDKEGEDIYLDRGGVFFKGEYEVKYNEFTFSNTADDIVLEGKLLEDGKFCFASDQRNGRAYQLYEAGKGIDESVRIQMDEYNGLSYIAGSGVQRTSHGTYVVDEDGYTYVATFSDGEQSGKTIHFTLGSFQSQRAFQIRDDEAFGWGELVRFAMLPEDGLVYYTSAYQLTLNGYGTATFNAGTQTVQYNYTRDGDVVTLTSGLNRVAGVAYIRHEQNRTGYMLYNADLDVTFEAENGATLKMDGLYTATYTSGSTTVSGIYTLSSAILGDYVVTLTTEAKEVYTFLIKTETTTEGEEEKVTRTFRTVGNGYSEYYYKNDSQDYLYYYSPLLVLNETGDGKATVYGFTEEGDYAKAIEGSYAQNEEGYYVFTAQTHTDDGLRVTPVDLSKVSSFVFSTDYVQNSEGSLAPVAFWLSMTTEAGTENFDKQYSSESDGKLTLVAGFAIYVPTEGDTVVGTYQTRDGITTVTSVTTGEAVYLELHEDDTFELLKDVLGTAYAMYEDGTASSNETLFFNGKGGVTYTDANGVQHVGFYSDAQDGTVFGTRVLRFTATSEGMTFEFILVSVSSTVYFNRYNSNYNGYYTQQTDEGSALLLLDGYGYHARYTFPTGETVDGMYYIEEKNVVCLVLNGLNLYFDLEGKNFTLRGLEAGTFALLDNQRLDGTLFELDGYGKLNVFTMETIDGESVRKELGKGTYTVEDGDMILTYTLELSGGGSEDVTLVGTIGTYAISSSQALRVFMVAHKEVVRNYLNEKDWTVLSLDEYGNAVKYGVENVTSASELIGSYVLITDTMLYYVNNAGTDAGIYLYDTERGTATPVTTLQAKGYYTKDLESLMFSQYGFMIENGTTRTYYNVDDQGNVTIYYRDEEAKDCNEYGFVEKSFGKFEETKEWNGKTYYQNSGYAVTFKRDDNTKTKYPVPVATRGEDGQEVTEKWQLKNLTFTPSGSLNFSVSGVVLLGRPDSTEDQSYNCTVVRSQEEGQEPVMYVQVQNFRFYITAKYEGEQTSGTNNTYEVTAMQTVLSAPSYVYLYYYYVFYSYFGPTFAASFPNTFGTITIIREFDENGDQEEEYFTGEFGEDAGMVDSTGMLFNTEKLSFEHDEESGLYTVKLKGKDDCDYTLYFDLSYIQQLGTYGYRVYALTRTQTLQNGGYTVEVERILTSDSSAYPAGSVWSIKIFEGENELELDLGIIREGVFYYVVRDRNEDGKITSTVYYKLTFTDKVSEGSGEDEETVGVPFYDKVEVEALNVRTLYTSDNVSYIDILEGEGGDPQFLYYGEERHLIVESSYDASSETYTVTTASGRVFTVTVGENDVITVSEVKE